MKIYVGENCEAKQNMTFHTLQVYLQRISQPNGYSAYKIGTKQWFF